MQHACNLFHSFDANQKLVAETGHCRKGAKLAQRKVFHTQVPDTWFGNLGGEGVGVGSAVSL